MLLERRREQRRSNADGAARKGLCQMDAKPLPNDGEDETIFGNFFPLGKKTPKTSSDLLPQRSGRTLKSDAVRRSSLDRARGPSASSYLSGKKFPHWSREAWVPEREAAEGAAGCSWEGAPPAGPWV